MPLYKLTPGQYGGYLDFFKRTSINEEIGKNELRAILYSAGRKPTDEELEQIIESISVNPEAISFQAFINFVSAYQELREVEQEYREAFRIYDVKGTGELTKEDIAYVFDKMQIKVDLDQLFKQVDTDNSGTIDYDEFCAMMEGCAA